MKYFRKFFSPSVSFILFQVVTLVFNVLIVNFFLQPYLLENFKNHHSFLEKIFHYLKEIKIIPFVIIFFLQFPFFILGLKIFFDIDIWKKYHHNKKIFCLGYLFSLDKSLYNKEFSKNKKIRDIEKKIIKIDHLRSKLFLFNLIILIPWIFFHEFVQSLQLNNFLLLIKTIILLLSHLLAISDLLWFFFFLPFQSKILLEQKKILESEI